ncbi:MAG: DUF4199 domain-containing protein [Flavobacterium sp.]|nr:DUF4199 domain-containing protein [Pedobacter sp.]
METTLQKSPTPKMQALNYGLIWAAINIAIFLVVYYVNPDLMGSFAFMGISVAVGLGLAVYFCVELRKYMGGFWSFKQALGSIFVMFFVQAIIVFFFTIAFAKFIEPEYVTKMKEISENTATKMMEGMGADQETIDKAMVEMEKNYETQFNPGFIDILKSIIYIAIGYFIGALIFAAIFKKEQPVFITEE